MWPRRVQRQRGATLLVIDPVDTHVDADLVGVRREGAREHIDTLSERYLGHPYRGPHEDRLILNLRPARIRSPLGRLG
jgi:hypothetical protein